MVFWRLKDGPMGRVFRVAFYLFLFILLLSVAGREIPEISNLADDPSNDGQVATAHNDGLPSPNVQRLDATDTSASFGNSQSSFEMQDRGPRNRGSWCHPFVVLAITGQGRLCFLAVRRT
jgi:hypothetical protein